MSPKFLTVLVSALVIGVALGQEAAAATMAPAPMAPADPCGTTPAAAAPLAPAPEAGEAAAAPAAEGGEGGGKAEGGEEGAAVETGEEKEEGAEEKGEVKEEGAEEKGEVKEEVVEVAKEAAEVGEKVAASGFATGFTAGFAEGGGIAEDEVKCIKTTLKDITETFEVAMKDLVGIAGELQAAPTAAQGKIREIMGKILEIMELMKSLFTECMNAEARQKVKEEIKTLVKNMLSFQFMKSAIITQWKAIEKDVFIAVTLIVNKEYEKAGEAIGKAMTLLLNSSPEAAQKYSVEDGSMTGRMFGTGASYYSSVLIALGLVFVLFVVVKVAKSRRALKVRAPTFSMGAGAADVMIDDVDTEGGDGETVE